MPASECQVTHQKGQSSTMATVYGNMNIYILRILSHITVNSSYQIYSMPYFPQRDDDADGDDQI